MVILNEEVEMTEPVFVYTEEIKPDDLSEFEYGIKHAINDFKLKSCHESIGIFVTLRGPLNKHIESSVQCNCGKILGRFIGGVDRSKFQ